MFYKHFLYVLCGSYYPLFAYAILAFYEKARIIQDVAATTIEFKLEMPALV
jgi:hypothetical protein